MNLRRTTAVLLGQAALPLACAFAAEGASYGGPVGGTDLGAALLPATSGLYGGLVLGYASGDRFHGNDGGRDPALEGRMASQVAALGLLYVYPGQVFGGTLASSLQGSVNGGRMELNGEAEHYQGFGDLYADLLMWSRYLGDASPGQRPTGATLKLAYSMVFPSGRYNTSDLYTSGRNVYFFVPNAALTYLGGPNALGEGLELSLHAFVNVASRNRATDYQSGTVANLNFAVGQRIGRWQLGLAGYHARQLDDDRQHGARVEPDGRRYRATALGPVLAYDLPHSAGSLKFKALAPVSTRNSLAANTAYVVWSRSL